MVSPIQWTWVWVNSGSWWWTGRSGVLQSMGSQIFGHDWMTELNWTRVTGPCMSEGKVLQGPRESIGSAWELGPLKNWKALVPAKQNKYRRQRRRTPALPCIKPFFTRWSGSAGVENWVNLFTQGCFETQDSS